jgi:hypothetical protein
MIALHPQLLAKRLRAAERERERYHANPEEQRDRKRRRYHESADARRMQRCKALRRLYGVTMEQYEEIVRRQGGVCAICGGVDSGKALSVDHCHATGRIRGACCDLCNRALGQMHDNPTLLRRAADYLEQNGGHLAGILKEGSYERKRSGVGRDSRSNRGRQPRRAAG